MKHTTKDQSSRTIVITGVTSGIGQATFRALAARGAYLIGTGRSRERCRQAKLELLAEFPDAHIDIVVADLASQRQIRRLADEISQLAHLSGEGKIDALVNNAGTVSSWYTATEDGYELQFAVNHLAPFLLTHELMPLLKTAVSARVITVSSGSHYGTKIHWEDIMYRRNYNILGAYKQSKLANVMFSAEFNRRLDGSSSIRAYAADPGLVRTRIGMKGTGDIVNWIWQKRSKGGVTPEQGAETVIFLATDPAVRGATAVYWKDCQARSPSTYAQRPDEAGRLWALSNRLCGIRDYLNG
jgi:NAD(P)-dependent dehydrogenase (short-subunit alcohol dehydrogenase family)